ncbi:hypothetical protein KCP91_11980 [Microvirga sp. SRT01]|uniref:Ig-like domain-containing protein n=1 Tax=Sphingomonas longa TaxID=2778730 RepID=A0ABS2D839_9SPHN|nr:MULTISPECIES: hypothetical protein [Alphaproteobacteria]MBM6577091.1 hypothetical protein [Sphingomonas sp. BT552]MBR7710135.1 hypothetical protein [Microvirga sp. SRT01]
MPLTITPNVSAMRCASGEPIVFQLQLCSTLGVPEDLTGRSVAFSVYDIARVESFYLHGVSKSDASGPFFEWAIDGTQSKAFFESGKSLRFQIAERLDNGIDDIVRGTLTIEEAAPRVDDLNSAPIARFVSRITRKNDPATINSPVFTVTVAAFNPGATPLPSWTAQPSITGSTISGQTLTGQDGTIANGSVTGRQWLRGGTAISGATSNTYLLVSADEGQTISYRVTATGAGGTNTSASPATATITAPAVPAPAFTVLPSATGTGIVGQTLTASDGTISNGTVSGRQWMRDGSPISGATGASYPLVSADEGKNIAVRVTATGPSGSTSATSNAIAVSAAPVAPSITTAPVVSGSSVVGQSLTTNTGIWTASPTSYAYQWLRDGAAISGATSSTYLLVSADDGKAVACRVTATNAVGSSSPATSNSIAVSAALAAPTNTSAPVVSGSGTVGQTLSSSAGGWTGSPTSYAYQWTRDGSAISGATASTYTLVSADASKTVLCRVTATNAAGSSSPTASNAIAVAAEQSALPAITVADFVAAGDSRTASGGGYSNSGGTEGAGAAMGASVAGWYAPAFKNRLLMGRDWNYGVGAVTSRNLTIRARVANNASTGNPARDETNVASDVAYNTGTQGKYSLNGHPAQFTVHFMDVNDGNPPFYTSPLASMIEESTQIDERQAGRPNGVQYVLNGMPKGSTPIIGEAKTVASDGKVNASYSNGFVDGESWGETGVVAADGIKVLSKTTGTPSEDQYSVTGGVWTFHSSRIGQTVYVSYAYQASGATSTYMRTMRNWKNSSSPAPFVDPDTGVSYAIAGLRYNRPFIRLVDSWGAVADLTRDPTGMTAIPGGMDILGIHQHPRMAYFGAYKPLKAAFEADYPAAPSQDNPLQGNNGQLATANGVLKVYSGTLPGAMASHPTVRSTTTFRTFHTSSGTQQIISNDGQGNLSATGVTGTVDAAGNYTLTYTTALANGAFLYAEQDSTNHIYNPYFDPAQGSGVMPTATGLTGSIPRGWTLTLPTAVTNALNAGTFTLDVQPVATSGGKYKMVMTMQGAIGSRVTITLQNGNGLIGLAARMSAGQQIRTGRTRTIKPGPNGRFYGLEGPGNVSSRISTPTAVSFPSPSGPVTATQHTSTAFNASNTYPFSGTIVADAGNAFTSIDITPPIDTTNFTDFGSLLTTLNVVTDGAKPISAVIEFSDIWVRATPN